MELFNEFKNQDFINICKMINSSFKNEYTLDEFKEFAKEIGAKDDLVDKLIDENAFALINEEEMLPIINFAENNNEMYAPILLTKMEKEYIKTLLDNELFCEMIGESLSKKLNESLKDIQSLNFDDIFIYKDSQKNTFKLSIVENINKLTDSMVNDYSINFKNKTTKGKSIPNDDKKMYCFLYTKASKLWQVITYNKEQERVILCNVSRLRSIEKAEESTQSLETDKLIEKKKTEIPLKLKVIEIYTSVERVFRIFSDYEIRAYYKDGHHFLDVYYYDFDKEKIIESILSLGDNVIIEKNGCPIYDDIVDIISKISIDK